MLIILALIAGVFVWLSQFPGSIEINWLGYHVITHVYALIAGLSLFSLLLYFLLGLKFRWRFFRLNRQFLSREKKLNKAESLLLEGLAAVAARDPSCAQKALNKLSQHSTTSPLSLVLAAQTAMLHHDNAALDVAFKKMIALPQTQFIGLRGLAMQYMNRGEFGAAKQLVTETLGNHPKNPWALETAFDLAVCMQDWDEAALALKKLTRQTPAHDLTRKTAIIDFERGLRAQAVHPQRALRFFSKAYAAAPEHTAFAIAYAQLLLEANQQKKAMKVIEKTWMQEPHPDLASLYIKLVDDPLEQYKRIQKLHDNGPQTWVSKLCLAEAAIRAHLWGIARPHLDAVIEEHPIQRAYQAMIRMEDALGHASAMKEWVSRCATEAIHNPDWRCQSCGYVAESWRSLCQNCNGFDRFQWTLVHHRDRTLVASQHLILPHENTP